jgi:hypothetical protein
MKDKRKIDWDKYYFYPELEKGIGHKIGSAIVGFFELTYFVFRYHTIAVLGISFGLGFYYYGVFLEQISGLWLIMCMLASVIIGMSGITLSILRGHGIC